MISDLNGSLGSRYFLYVMNEGQVLYRDRAHLQVSDWSLVLNELLTKKLPLCHEISGGYEKIVPASESFWSNLTFLRMMDLTVWW